MGAEGGSPSPGAQAERVERVVRVVPAVAALRKAFDYLVPAALGDAVRVGTEVRVVLHNRRVGGWVVEDDVEPPARVSLRPVAAVRGWGPPPAVVALASWAAWRWAGPVASFLRTASAPRAVRALPPAPRPSSTPSSPPTPVPLSPVPVRATANGIGGGVATGFHGSGRDGRATPPDGHDDPVVLAGQALVGGTTVVRLPPAADTASLVEAVAARCRVESATPSILVLAPAHRAAAQLAGRLRRAGHVVALLPDEWARSRAGGCVAVGSRAAAFAPLPRLGAAVVIDAHDEAYVEERAPTWSAWAVVAERARRDGAPCVLVSPCPTLELLEAGRLVTVSRRAERRGWPVVEVLDRTADDPRTGMFSERLVSVLRWAGERPGRRVACVLNRTGRARLLACSACGQLARCERCGGALELVDADGTGPVLSCRRCSWQRPAVCAHCGTTRLKALRVGVTRVREEIAALTGGAVAEMWGPASTAGGRPTDAGDDAASHTDGGPGGDKAPVVVGTEAVLHRLAGADAVCFLDFDAELLAPRFQAGEEALSLLARASRLVAHSSWEASGDDRSPGRVLVQTRQPRHEVIRAGVMADPALLSRSEHEVRVLLGLPPVTALAVLSGAAAAEYAAAVHTAAPSGVEVSGPVDGSWSVKAPDHAILCDLLEAVDRPAGRLRVEVDPVRR